MSDEEYHLHELIPKHAIRVWLVRFHQDKMHHTFLRHALMANDAFMKKYPKEAFEIAKDVGWPDDNADNPVLGPRPVDVQPF